MIREKIKLIMMELFETNSISDDIAQNNYANWDSLKHLTLAVAIEETFKISLEPDEIEQMISLDAIIKIIENKQ